MTNNNYITQTKEHTEINIDKRILPLFSSPVLLKKLSDQKRNKYNFLNPQKKLSYKIITLNKILEIYLKGISLYNLNLNNFLVPGSGLKSRKGSGQLFHNKLDLIVQLKNDEYYKLNIRLINFYYCIKKFLPVLKIKSLLYNVRLFVPKRLLKPEPNIRYSIRLRYISKLFIEIKNLNNNLTVTNEKRENKINRRQINKLLAKGNELMNEIDYLIIKKKSLIKKIKSNKILNLVNSLFAFNANAAPTFFKEGSLNKISDVTNLNINNLNQLTKGAETQTLKVKVDLLVPHSKEIKHNNYFSLLKINEKKLVINRIFNSINKSNEIKIEQTMNSIFKNKNFDCNTDSININSNPISMLYTPINSGSIPKPILNQYLKSMSIYNMRKNGIFIFYSNIISFNFLSNGGQALTNPFRTNKIIKNIYKLLEASFKSMYCLISKPVFVLTPEKVIIQFFFYLFIPNILKLKKLYKYGYKRKNKLYNLNWNKRKYKIKKLYRKFRKIKVKVRIKLRKLSNTTLSKVYPIKFKKLCEILSHLFKKPVELDLIRLHYPYNDSNILANLLGIMINKIKLRLIIKRLFEKAVIKNINKVTGKTKVNIIPAFLSGISIKVAGRLMTHRVVPRQTVKITRRGALQRGKVNFSDVARYTNKNKRGAFSITVASGQNYF